MNLYLISQTDNKKMYDFYDSAVVAAESEEDAKIMDPNAMRKEPFDFQSDNDSWATKKENVKVRFLGTGKKGLKKGVICASYNAG